MKILKSDWLIWLIILVPYVFIGMYWDKFPEQVPIHFNLQGEPDDYGSKTSGLILFPGINILLYFLFLILPRIDPSGKNYNLFIDKFKIIRILIHVFLSYIIMVTAAYSLGYLLNTTLMMLYGLTTLFLILGNYMGNIRHNYFIGVRTPWTLANEEVWKKTHRLTAKVWVIGSLLMMALIPFLSKEVSGIVFIIYVVVISIIPIAYSYLEFRKIKVK